MEEILYAGRPDSYWYRHFADYCNNAPKDDPLLPKAQASLEFIANRISLKRKVEMDAMRMFEKMEAASKTLSE